MALGAAVGDFSGERVGVLVSSSGVDDDEDNPSEFVTSESASKSHSLKISVVGVPVVGAISGESDGLIVGDTVVGKYDGEVEGLDDDGISVGTVDG